MAVEDALLTYGFPQVGFTETAGRLSDLGIESYEYKNCPTYLKDSDIMSRSVSYVCTGILDSSSVGTGGYDPRYYMTAVLSEYTKLEEHLKEVSPGSEVEDTLTQQEDNIEMDNGAAGEYIDAQDSYQNDRDTSYTDESDGDVTIVVIG